MSAMMKVKKPLPHFDSMSHEESLQSLIEHFGSLSADDKEGWHEGMVALQGLLDKSQIEMAAYFEVPQSTFSRWQKSNAPHPRIRGIYVDAAIRLLKKQLNSRKAALRRQEQKQLAYV